MILFCISYIVDNPADGTDALNEDLQRLTNWAKNWIVKFSLPKTKSLLTKKKVNDLIPHVMMDGTVVEDITSHIHFWVTPSKDLNWREHIETMATSASKCLDVLNALKYKHDWVTLEHRYVAFIRSKLEYADIVRDNCTQELSDLIESVQ